MSLFALGVHDAPLCGARAHRAFLKEDYLMFKLRNMDWLTPGS